MSFIPKQPKKVREQITVKLDAELLGTLDSYARYIESSRDYIIAHALQFVFKKDREFADWHQAHPGSSQRGSVGRGQQHETPETLDAITPDLQAQKKQRSARIAEAPAAATV
jgi:hypothetical protein